eukprot:TRINITY_DN33543_c0_g1_i2.p1 TRINITY_DN33543_c0_g1~~TRINITY_DN33543_c0_g1_i2.p1  ORF type:complete len:452 (-),score=59.62 TRINITY_DN33543_c0_g1_i2:7-1362(-)
MKHGSVYLGGISRGDTPPRDIPTLGAAGGRPKVSEMTAKELEKPCPYSRDDDARAPPRHEGMWMDVIKKSDVPPGPVYFPKDYDRCLLTEDIDRAYPLLAHPSSCAGQPLPWKFLEKPELPEVPYSCPRTHYPPIKRRPRDLSLRTHDIELAQPKKGFISYEKPPEPEYRASGRCTLDVSDISGTSCRPAVPVRNQYGNPMKCESEFRNPRHEAAIAAAAVSLAGAGPKTPRAQATPRALGEITDGVNDSHQKPAVFHREGHPLEPRYHVPVASEAGTSVHVRFRSEVSELGTQAPSTQYEEVGHVEGSKPKAGIRDNGEPQTSLFTHDIQGARPQRRAGVLPVNLYGPHGNRPVQSSRLDTSDIEGAQADTRLRAPRRTPRGQAATTAQAVLQPPQPLGLGAQMLQGGIQPQGPSSGTPRGRPATPQRTAEPSAGEHQATLRFAEGVEMY